MTLSDQSPSLSVESRLKGLQVELSETCALCLSRLLSLIYVPRHTGPQLQNVASVSPPSDDTVQPSSQLHLLVKLDCCLEDVNVFTVSNLAGRSIHPSKIKPNNKVEQYVCRWKRQHKYNSCHRSPRSLNHRSLLLLFNAAPPVSV